MSQQQFTIRAYHHVLVSIVIRIDHQRATGKIEKIDTRVRRDIFQLAIVLMQQHPVGEPPRLTEV